MIRVMLACNGTLPATGRMCPSFEPPAHVKFEETDGWIDATLEENDWTTLGDEHYCPQHNPALKGEVVVVTVDYTKLASGIEVRLPEGCFPGDSQRIEVRREGHVDAVAAARELIQQREKDGAVGAYDMADPALINVLIDYVLGLGA